MTLCYTRHVNFLEVGPILIALIQAQENVCKAVDSRNSAKRHNWLGESLIISILRTTVTFLFDCLSGCAQGTRIVEFEKIREVCDEYRGSSFTKGL